MLFIPMKIGCYIMAHYVKIAWGCFFLACLFVGPDSYREGGSLTFAFTAKKINMSKANGNVPLWAGHKKHDRKNSRRAGERKGFKHWGSAANTIK